MYRVQDLAGYFKSSRRDTTTFNFQLSTFNSITVAVLLTKVAQYSISITMAEGVRRWAFMFGAQAARVGADGAGVFEGICHGLCGQLPLRGTVFGKAGAAAGGNSGIRLRTGHCHHPPGGSCGAKVPSAGHPAGAVPVSEKRRFSRRSQCRVPADGGTAAGKGTDRHAASPVFHNSRTGSTPRRRGAQPLYD